MIIDERNTRRCYFFIQDKVKLSYGIQHLIQAGTPSSKLLSCESGALFAVVFSVPCTMFDA